MAVLGTGRTIAARLAELGHTVAVGTRDPQAFVSADDAEAKQEELLRRGPTRAPGSARR